MRDFIDNNTENTLTSLYEFLRHNFLSGNPEAMHSMAINRLKQFQSSSAGRALLRIAGGTPRHFPIHAMGLEFRHPVGVAAGFDKDAETLLGLQELGFSYIEVGTVTPRPQPGNPKPRVWRFPEAKALVNALGFPGVGMNVIAERLRRVRESGLLKIPVGINLGKNLDASVEQAADDYTAVLKHLYELGDYFVANISSPNTPGLRDLQNSQQLRNLVLRLTDTASALGSKPLLIKIAPDLSDDDVRHIAQFAREADITGIVAGNTTIQRDKIPAAASLDRGGLSGPPLFSRTIEMLKILKSELRSDQIIISAGGIDSSEKVQQCLNLGASLVQVYTAFIFLGPRCAKILSR